MKYLIPSLAALLTVCSGFYVYTTYYDGSDARYRFVLTTEVKDLKPSNSLNSATLDAGEKIFYWVKIFDLTKDYPHSFRCRIIDDAGEVLTNVSMEFTPKDSYYVFTCGTTPDPQIDSSGDWTFEGYVNEEIVVSETREVTLNSRMGR